LPELLIKKDVSERLDKSINIIFKEIRRITALVDRLIINTMPMSLRLKPVSINNIIEKMIEQFKAELELKNIRLILDLDPEIPVNPFDEKQIERCFINLFKNAIEAIESKQKLLDVEEKYFNKFDKDVEFKKIKEDVVDISSFSLPQGILQKTTRKISFLNRPQIELNDNKFVGIILIKTYIKDKNIVIEFQDNGCGISEENLKKIFDPYFTTKTSGSGLGLMLVHQVVREHNGLIEIISQVNEGTIFIITLPLAKRPIKLLTKDI
jgi:signal transduction histidine kinase